MAKPVHGLRHFLAADPEAITYPFGDGLAALGATPVLTVGADHRELALFVEELTKSVLESGLLRGRLVAFQTA
jgi:hypothetical protein